MQLMSVNGYVCDIDYYLSLVFRVVACDTKTLIQIAALLRPNGNGISTSPQWLGQPGLGIVAIVAAAAATIANIMITPGSAMICKSFPLNPMPCRNLF
jgi:hypothetical protein